MTFREQYVLNCDSTRRAEKKSVVTAEFIAAGFRHDHENGLGISPRWLMFAAEFRRTVGITDLLMLGGGKDPERSTPRFYETHRDGT
jgi:hypothetical protein